MNTTSTHDTKRSEDVRARIHVLSEIPDEWERQVRKWSRLSAALRRGGVPHPNEELLIYQTLVGMWPLHGSEEEAVGPRIREYLEKAAREAKTHSSWIAVNGEYESALKDFASALIEHEPFMASFRRFQNRIAFHGYLNSLSQVVLKVCSPGVPDFYQGTEVWDFSLVDPDNRRPVDFAKRAAMLAKLGTPASMLRSWRDGRIKLFVTARSLAVRARHAAAFREGGYRAIETGTRHAVAFQRGEDVLVVVPRLTASLSRKLPLGDVWGEFALDLPGRWRHAFTEDVVPSLALRDVFATFPVVVLERV
jgi:(1->4)-alpha-D-glucan 1-alpha-D-glucosylmutase